MGVLEFLGKAAKAGVNALQEKAKRIDQEKRLLSGYSDERLIREYKNGFGDRKIAAGMLLKERGYGSQSK